VIRRAANMYPADWRERYGDEFDALLEDQPASPGVLVDVVAGAVDAHLSGARGGFDMRESLRRPAMLGLVAGSVIWLSLTLLASWGWVSSGWGSFAGLMGSQCLVVASLLWYALSPGRQHRGILGFLLLGAAIWLACIEVLRLYVALLSYIGMEPPLVGGDMRWVETAFRVAQAVFAVAAIARAGLWRPGLALVLAASVMFALARGMGILLDYPSGMAVAVALPLGWLLVGLSGLRTREPAVRMARS
jgi:hypothetical protein